MMAHFETITCYARDVICVIWGTVQVENSDFFYEREGFSQRLRAQQRALLRLQTKCNKPLKVHEILTFVGNIKFRHAR
jgi:hypothetical protein